MPPDRLTSVRVRGYRCIRDVVFEPGPHRTVVVGGNASGKSSLLDALGLVADLIRYPSNDVLTGELRGNIGEGPLPFGHVASAFGGGTVDVDLEFVVGPGTYRYALALEAAEAGTWRVARESLEGATAAEATARETLVQRDASGARVRRVESTGPGLVPVLVDARRPSVTLGEDSISYPDLAAPRSFLAGMCILRPVAAVMRGHRVPDDRYPDRYGRDLSGRLLRVITEQPQVLPTYLRFMQEFVGWVWLSARLRRGDAQLLFKEGAHPSPLAFETASDGTVLEAWLLALALDPPPAARVYLLDDPAAPFFRTSIQRPAELVKTIAARHQVILATHAAPLVSELAGTGDVWIASRRPGEGTELRRLSDVPSADEAVVELGLGEAALVEASEVKLESS